MTSYQNSQTRTLNDKLGEFPSVKDFGAAGDCIVLEDGAITVADYTFTSVSASFTSADVGKAIGVVGAGAAGVTLVTTIASVTSGTEVELTAAAGTTVSDAFTRYGTDNTTAFQGAIDAILAAGSNRGGVIFIPRGHYLTSGSVTLYDNIRLCGENYAMASTYGSALIDAPSMVTCIAAVPVLATPDPGDPAVTTNGVTVEMLGVQGTPDSGSMGIYSQYSRDFTVKHCFFDLFGDSAINLEGGATCHVAHNFAQNSMLVHSGRSDYIGVFQIGVTDCIVLYNNINSNFVGPATTTDGYIAALCINYANGFVAFNQCAQAEVGLVVTARSFANRLIGNRADLNAREGIKILAGRSIVIGNTVINCSRDGDGLHDGFVNSGVGNTFQGNRIEATTPIDYHLKNGFVDTSSSGYDYHSNTWSGNWCSSLAVSGQMYDLATGGNKKLFPLEMRWHTGETEFNSTGNVLFWDSENGYLSWNIGNPLAQVHIYEATQQSPAKQARLRLESDYPSIVFRSLLAPVDEAEFSLYVNAGPDPDGYGQLVGNVVNAAHDVTENWLVVDRADGTVRYVQFPKGYVWINKSLRVGERFWIAQEDTATDTTTIDEETGLIQFGTSKLRIAFGVDDPEEAITAVGGSIYLRASSGDQTFYVKAAGTGDTGWKKVGDLIKQMISLIIYNPDPDDAPTFFHIRGNGHANQTSTPVFQIDDFANPEAPVTRAKIWNTGNASFSQLTIDVLDNSTYAQLTCETTSAQSTEPVFRTRNLSGDIMVQISKDGDLLVDRWIGINVVERSAALEALRISGLVLIEDDTIRLDNETANRAVYLNADKDLTASAATDTELGYLSGVTSAIQTQLGGKAPSSHQHGTADITGCWSGSFTNGDGNNVTVVNGLITAVTAP